MSEIDMAVSKPEIMQPYIWLQTPDGAIQQVEQEIAMFCPFICQEVIQKGTGSSKNCAICLPQRVTPTIFSLILDYCRFHQVAGRSNKERKSYDEKFMRMDTKQLCELTSAADSLQLKPLVDLTSRTLARIIEGKSPEEIRGIFNLPDDLTENVEVEEENVDDRSVDDLLSFINGNDADPKEMKNSKNKKKNRRRKEQQTSSSLKEASELNNKEINGHNIIPQTDGANGVSEASQSNTEDSTFVPREFDDGDIDEDIDPALQEKLDREVEDFARILNSDWPERMQELLSLGQERKAMPFTSNGNRLDLMILSHKQEGISGKWILTSPRTNGLWLEQF
ncbi:hypothetical protein Ahy_B04g072081 isoform B [Arachis hypogaea]|uniref:SKP1 component dimerisation domain-containing protein n=1 Tax=Arachis hypogaea TaxID=3818 RepID=A0A444ZMB5_ARAHY|nr:hypothetical protein Ahy_B04g072081 isoform B [Arachis hypogaea]